MDIPRPQIQLRSTPSLKQRRLIRELCSDFWSKDEDSNTDDSDDEMPQQHHQQLVTGPDESNHRPQSSIVASDRAWIQMKNELCQNKKLNELVDFTTCAIKSVPITLDERTTLYQVNQCINVNAVSQNILLLSFRHGLSLPLWGLLNAMLYHLDV